MSATVLGDIVERKPSSSGSKSSSKSNFVDVPTNAGFPKAHHRSERLSAFATKRAQAKDARSQEYGAVPIVRASLVKDGDRRLGAKESTIPKHTTVEKEMQHEAPQDEKKSSSRTKLARHPLVEKEKNDDSDAAWRLDMETENDTLVQSMDDDQKEKERTEIVEQLGPDVLELMSKIQARRAVDTAPPSRPRSAMSHHSRAEMDDSIAANKALRKLRFSEKPDKVFVYESQPSSPKRILALLPAPPTDKTILTAEETGDTPAIADTSTPKLDDEADVDEHTPDAIRKKYFPNEPPASENPTLAWMTPSSVEENKTAQNLTSTRYDLQGRVIPPHLISKLPSHLGLHHHGDNPDEAGYTLDDLLMLSRSTLPVQRAATLQVLARLLARQKTAKKPPNKESLQQTGGEQEQFSDQATSDTFQKCLIVGIEAFGERASATVRMAGLDVIWAGIVLNDNSTGVVDGTSQESGHVQSETLPLSYFYSAALFNFTRTTLNSASLVKLFEVLKSLILTSTKVAEELIELPELLDGAVRSASLVSTSDSSIDVPATLALLGFVKEFISISRKCARALIPGVSDSFLRHIVTLPSPDQPSSLQMVAGILEFYTLLGRYGLGASIASTGQEYLQHLTLFVTRDLPLDSPENFTLIISWLRLIETWIICATNPHKTTPEHDIIWSQVVAWQWSAAIINIRTRLLRAEAGAMSNIWAQLWRTWAAWLQGCRVNEINQGDEELRRSSDMMRESMEEGGHERALIDQSSSTLQEELYRQPTTTLMAAARVLHSAAHLFEVQSIAPSPLKVSTISVVENVTKAANWAHVQSICTPVELRIWTNMLALLVKGMSIDLHYRVLNLLVPGDEMQAARMISDILSDTLKQTNAQYLELSDDLWTTAGGPAKILLPLYQYALWPQEGLFISPLVPHAPALPMTTTLILPTNSVGVTTPSGGIVGIQLPQRNLGDWMISALDILLRSGSTHSRLFRSLPKDWTASESEVVRSLLLLLLLRRIPLSRAQLVFTCMKVFMLEHDQATLEDGEEVYQNPIVGQLMSRLVYPLRLSSISDFDSISHDNPRLDTVAKSFLGADQPFFQFYSDFLGLYDSSSFGHKLFGTFTLPPTSQLYPRDYRRLLWGDYSHAIRSIQVDVPDILSTPDELHGWLWPIEGTTDGEMLSLYVKSLVRGHVTGFIRFVAIHQVAGCLWPDMTGKKRQAGAKVLKAILTSADESLLSDVLYYRQSPEGSEVILPPRCYDLIPFLVRPRLDWAVSVAGESVRKRFPS